MRKIDKREKFNLFSLLSLDVGITEKEMKYTLLPVLRIDVELVTLQESKSHNQRMLGNHGLRLQIIHFHMAISVRQFVWCDLIQISFKFKKPQYSKYGTFLSL